MAANLKLPKLEGLTINQCLYQSMLGSLMYVAIGTQPDIMFLVHYLSQFSGAPGAPCSYEVGLLVPKWDSGPQFDVPW